MMYSRLDRHVAHGDHGAHEQRETERDAPRPGGRDETTPRSDDNGAILTLMLVGWGFLGLLAYVGMYGP